MEPLHAKREKGPLTKHLDSAVADAHHGAGRRRQVSHTHRQRSPKAGGRQRLGPGKGWGGGGANVDTGPKRRRRTVRSTPHPRSSLLTLQAAGNTPLSGPVAPGCSHQRTHAPTLPQRNQFRPQQAVAAG